MQIPNQCKIGGIVYKVIVVDTWPGRQRGDHDGECFYDQEHGNVIYIGAELSHEAQEITFLHEAFHAMNATMDHEFLDSLAEQLYQFLADNGLLKGHFSNADNQAKKSL